MFSSVIHSKTYVEQKALAYDTFVVFQAVIATLPNTINEGDGEGEVPASPPSTSIGED